ncbi:hypothetical protein OROMI_008227 [Orobanche minor]
MDRKWIVADRLSKEYKNGVKEFCTHAAQHACNPGFITCPCQKCMNVKTVSDQKVLYEHLICHGIDKTYTVWTYHGEGKGQCSSNRLSPGFCCSDKMDTNIGPVDRDGASSPVMDTPSVINEELLNHPDMHEKLRADAGLPLWPGCTKATKLSAVLTLYNLKAGHQVSDVFFTELLQVVSDLLPDDNVLPRRAYEAKQMLKLIGLTHEKIHACPKDCILYRKEYADLGECPKCGTKRYKKNKSPAKVMWYFPIIPRLRRLYSSPSDAKNLVWHQDERIKDGMLRHPADSPQWKKFDDRYPEFGKEPRNLRLVLSSDGMNPFGIQSTSHSTWPVVLMIYNLSPSLCMKRRYMMLSTLIPGPKQPGNDIDVYLAPLIDDLKLLWDQGIDVYDGYRKDNFMLKAMLFGTINDFPAYGNLSGYSVKGHGACPWCTEDTDHLRLAHCQKSVYMGHRRWLGPNHRYRTMSEAFNGEVEERKSPDILSGEAVLEKVENIETQFGKKFSKKVPTQGWKKKSIFFQLSYWKDLYVRHFIDLMHNEKNVCASILNTLLADKEKSKDGYKARMDMVDLGIRGELAPVIEEGKSPYLPPAAHTLSKCEKKVLLETLQSVKVPEGYSSNIRSLVSEDGLKLTSLKSHDYHVIIETLLPIAIRSILPENVRTTITKLCWFFKAMSSKVIDPRRLSNYQKQIVETLCELEMYFPPSFFDIMVHLTVHLVYETRMCGPGRMRWMYGMERYMKVFKGYVMSRRYPEGCIAERYIVEEALEYWSEYIPNVESIGLPTTCHTGRINGEGVTGGQQVEITLEQRRRVHLYILHNSVDVLPFVKLHKQIISHEHLDRDLNWIEVEHNRTFIDWFRNHISEKLLQNESISEMVKWLSRGPDTHVFSYKCYLINGYTFYTRDHDENSTMQNSGLSVLGNEDENLGTTYFGQIVKIWEVDYVKFQVPVFDCSWVDIPGGVQVENNGFIRVDLNKVGFKDDSFVMATQAKQVFYVSDPVDKKWSIVILSNKSNNSYQVSDHVDEDVDAIDDPFENMVDTPNLLLNDDAHEPPYQRLDHDDGEYVDLHEDEYVNPDFFDIHGHERETAPRKRKRKTKAKKTKKRMSMTSRSRRGGESQKDDLASGRHGTQGTSTPGNSDQDNDGHSGSQGASTSGNSEISHPPARGIVDWNGLGQPIGKESITLAHYVGALARRTFPITITDFRKKELAKDKEAFWDEIMEPPRRYVGKGILHNGPSETCHGVRLEAGYVRVQFEVAVEEEKDTMLPVPCDEARTVGGAPGYFLPWPKKLVSLEKSILKPRKMDKENKKLHKETDKSGTGKKNERTLESTGGAPQRPLGYPLPGDSSHDDVILVLLRAIINMDVVTDIEVPIKSYFNGEFWIEHIGRENIMEILDDQWLSSSSIVLYIRYLGDVYLSKNPELSAKFSFASPHTVPPLVDLPAASNYLADCLLRYVGVDHLVLMPNNVGKHWVLVAINTKTESIYYMDPAKDGKVIRNQNLKQLVEHGMRAFRTRRPGSTTKAQFNSFKWNNIQCPKQPDGIHSGYYVGCFIESILLTGETSIPVSFVNANRLECYPPSKMKMFRVNWTGYLYNRFLKEKMAGK